jgi:integrase
VKDIFSRAVDWKIIKNNPVADVRRPKIRQKEVEVYNEQEAERLFEALEKEPLHWRILIILALTTGLRRGELLALEWKHVDLLNGIIDVKQSLSHSNGENIIKEPKTKNSVRRVSLPAAIIPDLNQYKLHMEKEKSTAEIWEGGDHFFVFSFSNGKPYYHTVPRRWFSRFLQRNGFKHIRFHDLRHTSATLLINKGVHAKTISARLGHADIRTTMNVYGHALQTADQAAADKFDSLLLSRKRNSNATELSE